MTVKFTSIDDVGRTVTMDVDGSPVTRNIPAQYFGTIDDYITALASGLEIEAAKAAETPKEIGATSFKANDVVTDKSKGEAP